MKHATLTAVQSSAPLYIISYRMKLDGRWTTGTYELDFDRMTLANVIDDILTGQFEDVDRVYVCVPGESCTDITEYVARQVRDRIVNEQLPRGFHVDWLHGVLGTSSIAWPVEEYA